MPTALRPYWMLAAASFRSRFAYTGAMWASMAANIMFGFIRASVLTNAAHAHGGNLAGYTAGQLNAYVWWSQALLGTIPLWGITQLEKDIKSGQVATEMIKPVSIVGSGLAQVLGRSAFTLIPRVVPVLAVGALLFGFAPPPGVVVFTLGMVSVLLAATLAFLCNYCLGALAFWVLEVRGYRLAYQAVGMFLAGLYVPIPMFPGALATAARWLPFASMVQTPTDILAGVAPMPVALGRLAIQLGWVIVIGALALLLTRMGRAKLEVQGG